jgi:RNA polymerase sigma-70 factor (ECF subfamily)
MTSAAAFIDRVSQLVRAHRARLARVARAEGLTAEDALDCVQESFETFLQLPRADALAHAGDDAARLLTVIARNAARNRRRRRYLAAPHSGEPALLESLPGRPSNHDDLIARAEDHLRLHACVRQLGELQRQVVTLRLLEERPGEDVAALLGLTAGNVAVLLHRAKQRLRTCMECGESAVEEEKRDEK